MRDFFAVTGCAALGVFAIAGAAEAQQSVSLEEALGVCSKIDDSNERVACFDSIAKAVAQPQANAPVKSRETAADLAAPNTSEPRTDAPVTDASTPTVARAETPKTTTSDQEKRFVVLPSNDPRLSETSRHRPEPAERPKNYESTIARARYVDYQTLLIQLDNGEIWKQIWPNRKMRLPKAGASVTIKRAPVGGWFISIDGATDIKMVEVKH